MASVLHPVADSLWGFEPHLKSIFRKAEEDELLRDLAAVASNSVKSGASTAGTKAIISSRFTKKFEGDRWGDLVKTSAERLRLTFMCEASIALHVPQDAISNIEFRIGSLYVTFHVTHDDDITEEEMDARIEEYPFREMWRLYNQRDGAPDGLDAALQQIQALEADLRQKERELDRAQNEGQQKIKDLEGQLAHLQDDLSSKALEREKDLLGELGKEQEARKEAGGKLRALEEQNKKLFDNLKREKQRSEKAAQRQNDLIAALMQENKKEKEAKEREYNEQLEVKDYIIENLKSQIRSKANGIETRRNSIENDRSDEFSNLMSRIEEMALVLQKSQESETEARAEIQRLTDSLKFSENAREADSVTYKNDILALKQQLNAFRDSLLAENHEKRAEDNRSRRSGNVNKESKENETIVRQYETALENLVGTLLDRLTIMRDEYASYLKVSQEEVDSEKSILEDHEEDSKAIRKTFRTSSIALQKIYWGTREDEVPAVIRELDSAAAGAEKSSAAIKVTVAMLNSKLKDFAEQKEWMESHQQAMHDLLNSLSTLNKRAFERQLTLMNNNVVNNVN